MIPGYGVLRYWLDVRWSLLPVDQNALNYFIPLLLSLVGYLLIMRRRLHVLRFNDDKLRLFYQIVFCALLMWPACTLQRYISLAAYPLELVTGSQEISALADSRRDIKFVALTDCNGHCGVDHEQLASYASVKRTSEHSQVLMMRLYFAAPLISADVYHGLWYGYLYQQALNAQLSDADKNHQLNRFWQQSRVDFGQHQLAQASYFELLRVAVGEQNNIEGYSKALRNHPLPQTADIAVILVPHYDKFSDRGDDALQELLTGYLGGALTVLLMLLVPRVSLSGSGQLLSTETHYRTPGDKLLDDLLRQFDPRGPRPATALLLNLNIGVFILCILWGIDPAWASVEELTQLGAVRRDLVLEGEMWRLITAVLIHGSASHLLINLMILAFAGYLLEPVAGGKPMLLVYFCSGVTGSMASIWAYEGITSVGASGAVFGMIGSLLVFAYRREVPESKRLPVLFLTGVVLTSAALMGSSTHTDNAAHLGGLLSGSLITLLMRHRVACNP